MTSVAGCDSGRLPCTFQLVEQLALGRLHHTVQQAPLAVADASEGSHSCQAKRRGTSLGADLVSIQRQRLRAGRPVELSLGPDRTLPRGLRRRPTALGGRQL